MFTIKFYQTGPGGSRQVIKQAESFTILRSDDGSAEITLHQKDQGDDRRIDIVDCGPNGPKRPEGWPPCFESAIIENAAGKTTEMISCQIPSPSRNAPSARDKAIDRGKRN
jgi:hypothetical protein